MTDTAEIIAETNKMPVPFRVGIVRWLSFMAAHTPGVSFTLALLLGCTAACLAAGVVAELRWVMVAMMLLLLVMPMVAAFLFFVYGLKDINSLNLAYHTAEESEKGITVEILGRKELKSDRGEGGKKEEGKGGEKEESEEREVIRKILIERSRISGEEIAAGGKWLGITSDNGTQWLYLPE